jgi:hypothetical protein
MKRLKFPSLQKHSNQKAFHVRYMETSTAGIRNESSHFSLSSHTAPLDALRGDYIRLEASENLWQPQKHSAIIVY